MAKVGIIFCLIGVVHFLFAQADTSQSGIDTQKVASDSIISEQPKKLELKLGDKNDGNRSIPIHLIDIFDEEGMKIFPEDRPQLPFSTKQTCLPCHNYEIIRRGWHFNALDQDVPPGRRGEPWILYDPLTATQLPLSYRSWPGSYRPEDLGINYFTFTRKFGRHFPGGGPGEKAEEDDPDAYVRWMVSGQLEINCLSCHNAHPEHDQAEFAAHVTRENYRWAAAASSGLAIGKGSAKDMPNNFDIYFGIDPDNPRAIPPSITYKPNIFDERARVFFNLVRKVPAERCYFCHSTVYLEENLVEMWEMDEDVHLKAGMTCVDCHRNGLDHMIVRGYEGESEVRENPVIASFTCKGCHLGTEDGEIPLTGRLGAPRPEHKGIPTVHFERLSCTACHSGPWPTDHAYRIKTSRANALGTHTVNRNEEIIPKLQATVFVKDESGKIEPHKLLWPSFWAEIKGDSVTPLLPEKVQPAILKALAADTLTDSMNYEKILSGDWPELSRDQIILILKELSSDSTHPMHAAYIGGGKLYKLSKSGDLVKENHPAAQPYTWAFAHDVRPASQSLGIHGCNDCHNNSAPFYFSKVAVLSPLKFQNEKFRRMTSFEKTGVLFPRLFAMTFIFRPWLKLIIFICSIIIASVLILYAFKGLDKIIKVLADQQ